MAATLDAWEADCVAVVFSRDTDGDPDRAKDIEKGVERAQDAYPVRVVGGVAHHEIEAWMLALRGQLKSEDHTDAKRVLEEAGAGRADTAVMVAIVENADLEAIPADAHTLRAWLESARRELPGVVRDHAGRAP